MDVTVTNPTKQTHTLGVAGEEFAVKPGTNVLKPKHPGTTHRHVADAVASQLGVHGVEAQPEKKTKGKATKK